MMLCEILKNRYGKEVRDCTNREIYSGLIEMIKTMAKERPNKKQKKLYYVSAEFLIGRLLSNNLINLGIYDEVEAVLKQNGKSLAQIEEEEPEPSLGNGGLGRLAACFLDSVASMGLCGDGIGINYHYGLFKQKFENNKQAEFPDKWIENESWLVDSGRTYFVEFGGFSVNARMYDIDVTGYNNCGNKLHLFDVYGPEKPETDGLLFDKKDVKSSINLFLYPDDSDTDGRMLRIYQEYFLVSCGAQLILDECVEKGSNLYDLDEFAVVQINDTHPTMIIPELIRQLKKRGIKEDEAIKIVGKVCAYTNHTILSEALEKWPIEFIEKVSPDVADIIKTLDARVKEKYKDEKLHIIDKHGTVYMAHIDLHYCFSVNGVAHLHTKILKENELNGFYNIYPHKFNNKTNGISFRRWLLKANVPLSRLIEKLIGNEFKTKPKQLEKLKAFVNDESVLNSVLEIKSENKKALKEFFFKTSGTEINENAIFDVQIKRLHEYKRQQLNALYIIHKYLKIKSGEIPKTPICVIFGAKAAPAYTIAKDIIHLILCLSKVIGEDCDANKHLQVVMAENYNVTWAEKIIPAADISQQISLASKEASGTGNMKLMLNGAVTIGTLDGANVEITGLVGNENIYIFGAKSDEVVKRYKDGSYNAKKFYNENSALREAVDFITSDKMLECGDKESLSRLKNELLNKDWFMTFPDFDDYVRTRERAYNDYENKIKWAKKMLTNISCAGYFSSDRTVCEYNNDIWHLKEDETIEF